MIETKREVIASCHSDDGSSVRFGADDYEGEPALAIRQNDTTVYVVGNDVDLLIEELSKLRAEQKGETS